MTKVWFITGAGSGIGAGAAKAALAAGDRVVATGRNVQKVRDALRHVASENLEILKLDVSNEAEVKTAIGQAAKKFNRIDVVLNNAGYSLLGNFEALGIQDIERQFATNFWGVLHVMRAALPMMRKQHSGHIINLSSVAGVVGLQHCTAYGASKFAVEGLSLSLVEEVEKFGIKITVVEPGFFRTDLLDRVNAVDGQSRSSGYDATEVSTVGCGLHTRARSRAIPAKPRPGAGSARGDGVAAQAVLRGERRGRRHHCGSEGAAHRGAGARGSVQVDGRRVLRQSERGHRSGENTLLSAALSACRGSWRRAGRRAIAGGGPGRIMRRMSPTERQASEREGAR